MTFQPGDIIYNSEFDTCFIYQTELADGTIVGKAMAPNTPHLAFIALVHQEEKQELILNLSKEKSSIATPEQIAQTIAQALNASQG